MELSRFQELVEKLQDAASADPAGYRRRVGLLALLGYVYLGVVLVGLIGATTSLVWALFNARLLGAAFKLVVPLLFLLVVMLRALWVRFTPPEGIEVDPATTPALAALLDEIRTRSEGPRVDRVLLTTDFNASVVQHPRLGIFGWYENYLTLGLPLLQTIPRDEMRAIVAHEFGHLAGSHGRFGARIYRQRLVYQRFAASIEAEDSKLGGILLAPLRRWYFPYFNAYSFALARQQEYEADQLAAEVAGTESMRRALARITVVGRWDQQRFWPDLDRTAREGHPVPGDLYERYPAALAGSLTEAEAAEWMAEALRIPTDFHDSHPGLRDRLEALAPGTIAPVLRFDGKTANGMELLAPRVGELLGQASTQWREVAAAQWVDRHKHVTRSRDRLATLEAKLQASALSTSERWERVRLTEEILGLAPAAVLARDVLADDPTSNGARFLVARALLAEGNDEGLRTLEEVVRREPSATPVAAELAFGYLWTRGRRDEAEGWRLRGDSGHTAAAAAEQERRQVTKGSPLAPPDLKEEEIDLIRGPLLEIPGIREAYIARRVVKHLPDAPCYLLGVVPRVPWWRPIGQKTLQALVQEIVQKVEWPVDTRIVTLTDQLKGLRKRMRKIPGATLIGPT
jgi:hypothetical protein